MWYHSSTTRGWEISHSFTNPAEIWALFWLHVLTPTLQNGCKRQRAPLGLRSYNVLLDLPDRPVPVTATSAYPLAHRPRRAVHAVFRIV